MKICLDAAEDVCILVDMRAKYITDQQASDLRKTYLQLGCKGIRIIEALDDSFVAVKRWSRSELDCWCIDWDQVEVSKNLNGELLLRIN